MSFPDVKRRGFSRTFRVANQVELFAYCGSKAVLAVYIAGQVGLGPESAGGSLIKPSIVGAVERAGA